MPSKKMSRKKIKIIRVGLIAVGLLCIGAVLAREAMMFPWAVLFRPKTELVYKAPPAEAVQESQLIIPAEILEQMRAEEAAAREAEDAQAGAVDLSALSLDETIAFGEEKNLVQPEVPDEPLYLAEVSVPVLDVREGLYEGTTNREMYRGFGHLTGSALPGKYGNSVISAHRVAINGMEPLKYLDRVQNGDTVTVTCDGTEYVYEIFDSFIVTKEDNWVLYPDWNEPKMLTLITCDPLIYPGGDRPNRLIVRARLVV